MKKLIKKISVAAATLGLMAGVVTTAYAAEPYSFQFELSGVEGNVSDYSVKVWTDNNSEGQKANFSADGKCTIVLDVEADEDFHYIVKDKEDSKSLFPNVDKPVAYAEGNTAIIKVNQDGEVSMSRETTEIKAEEPVVEDTTDATVVEQDVVAEKETTVKPARQDDPDKDYSVGKVKVIIIDVVFLALAGVGVYLFFGREKKPLKK